MTIFMNSIKFTCFPDNQAVMLFLNHALSMAYVSTPKLFPILIFRMLKISLENGMCDISAHAFGLYGALLVKALDSDFDVGYRMGHIAIQIMRRLSATSVSLK